MPYYCRYVNISTLVEEDAASCYFYLQQYQFTTLRTSLEIEVKINGINL